MTDVAVFLEEQGLQAFSDSFTNALVALEAKASKLEAK